MSAVVAQNLTIDKGTTFEETFYFTNDDSSVLILNDSVAIAKLRKHPFSETYYSFSCEILELQGAIVLTMDSEITSTLPSGRCVYDIIIEYDGGKMKKLVEGTVIIKESVSI